MTRLEGLHLLEESLGMKPGTLHGGECLADLDHWDSLSTMSFIVFVDKRLHLPLPVSKVVRCRTVDELVDLLGPIDAREAA